MRFTGGQTEKQNIENLMMYKYCHVTLFLWCYREFREVKHAEKLMEHVEGVIYENGHCAGSIRT